MTRDWSRGNRGEQAVEIEAGVNEDRVIELEETWARQADARVVMSEQQGLGTGERKKAAAAVWAPTEVTLPERSTSSW